MAQAKRWATVSLVFSAAFVIAATIHNAGFVVKVDGEWLVGNTPVKQGQSLSRGRFNPFKIRPAARPGAHTSGAPQRHKGLAVL